MKSNWISLLVKQSLTKVLATSILIKKRMQTHLEILAFTWEDDQKRLRVILNFLTCGTVHMVEALLAILNQQFHYIHSLIAELLYSSFAKLKARVHTTYRRMAQ